jgi:hypothetical protein
MASRIGRKNACPSSTLDARSCATSKALGSISNSSSILRLAILHRPICRAALLFFGHAGIHEPREDVGARTMLAWPTHTLLPSLMTASPMPSRFSIFFTLCSMMAISDRPKPCTRSASSPNTFPTRPSNSCGSVSTRTPLRESPAGEARVP